MLTVKNVFGFYFRLGLKCNTFRSGNKLRVGDKTGIVTRSLAAFRRNIAWVTSLPPYSGIPHLRGNLVTGRLPYLRNGGLIDNMLEAAKLGGISSFWVSNKLILLLSDPDVVYDYKTQYHTQYMSQQVHYWDTLLGVSAANHDFRRTREIYSTIFEPDLFHQAQDKISDACNSSVSALRAQNKLVIGDPERHFRLFSLRLALKIFMGCEDAILASDDELLEWLGVLYAGSDRDSLLLFLNLKEDPINRYFSKKELKKLYAYTESMKVRLNDIVLKPNKEKILNQKESILYKLWMLGREARGENDLTVDNLFPEFFFVLAGGPVAGIGDGFMAVVQLICEHPEVKQKLVELLLSDEMQGLKYLDQIIKEAFRLKPPVTVIPAHVVDEAFEFNGVKLQKGDTVLIAPYVCHHNPKVWREPALFDPDRFSEENEQDIPPGAYLPFGLGDRRCPGSTYALSVLRTYIVALFREFDVHIENHLSQQGLCALNLCLRHGYREGRNA